MADNEFKQYELPAPEIDFPSSYLEEQQAIGSVGVAANTLESGYFQSKNYVSGASGWYLGPDTAEINVPTAIKSLDIPDTVTANSFHVETDGDTFWGCTPADFVSDNDNANAYILKDGTAKFQSVTLANSVEISGIANNSNTDLALLEMSHNIVFSVTDADTIAWAAGTMVFSNGRTFSIDAGNTGNMAAITYIYLDPDVSETVLQTTTTYSTASGGNKRILGVARNQTTTASFVPYGPGQILVDGDNIGAASILAANIAASTITADKLSVTTLSAVTADMGTLTAGKIDVGNIEINADNEQILFGSATAPTTGIGIFLGKDGSDYEFRAGDPDGSRIHWDGSALRISGTGYISRFFTAGENISAGDVVAIKGDNTHSIELDSGSSEYLTLGDNADLELPGAQDFTIELWVNIGTAPSVGNHYAMVSNWGNSNDHLQYSFNYFNYGGTPELRLQVRRDNNTTAGFSTAVTLTPGTWYHVAVVFDQNDGGGNSVATFYVDADSGTSGGSTTAFNIKDAQQSVFDIGAEDNGGSPARLFDGMIDEVRVWDDVRSTAEIQANYDIELTGAEANLIGYWKLNNALTDSSANGNDLTNPNSAAFSTDTGFFDADTPLLVKGNALVSGNRNGNIIGFAVAAITSGSEGEVVVAGVAENLSSLNTGRQYYVSDTPGAVSESAGTVSKKIGIAVSTTEMLVTNIW